MNQPTIAHLIFQRSLYNLQNGEFKTIKIKDAEAYLSQVHRVPKKFKQVLIFELIYNGLANKITHGIIQVKKPLEKLNLSARYKMFGCW